MARILAAFNKLKITETMASESAKEKTISNDVHDVSKRAGTQTREDQVGDDEIEKLTEEIRKKMKASKNWQEKEKN